MKTGILYPLFITLIILLNTGASYSQIHSSPSVAMGDVAPIIKGKDQHGHWINSEDLVKKGPVILIFYRGNWCPYCRKHLSNLQDSLQLILNQGASIVVVTPEAPESIIKMIDQTEATFSIIHDEQYQIMNDYGVSFQINELTVPRYLNGVLKNTREANQNEDDVLPVPATFILDEDHRVMTIHFDPDYHNRMAVSDILKHLKNR